MKKNLLAFALMLMPVWGMAQQTYSLSHSDPAKPNEEKVLEQGGGKTIVGVTHPSITVYLPKKEVSTGAAVILCPGGGMRALSWTSDVERMAQFLNERGVAAIGLKYRLNTVPFAPGGGGKMPPLVDVTGFQKFAKANCNPMPGGDGDIAILNAVADAREAIALVRSHATEWGIDASKVGYLGFSAGGGVAIGATVHAQEGEMPDFLVSVYGPSLLDVEVPQNAPDLLLLTRAEHGNVAAGCLQLFLEWKKAGKNAELHMYGDGNGPFFLSEPTGTNTTETWADNLTSWMRARKLIK